jgi:hypothetical protein
MHGACTKACCGQYTMHDVPAQDLNGQSNG